MIECGVCSSQDRKITHSIAVPCVHSNGTHPNDLREQLETAMDAMRAAIRAVELAAPNGRDYYPTDSTQRAIKEHCIRQEKLADVAMELQQQYEHVLEAIEIRCY